MGLSACLAQALGMIPALHNWAWWCLSMILVLGEMESRGAEVLGHPQLRREFDASQGNM